MPPRGNLGIAPTTDSLDLPRLAVDRGCDSALSAWILMQGGRSPALIWQ